MLAKIVKITAIACSILTIIFILIYQWKPTSLMLSLAITFGTTSYHFLMRLLVGYVFNGIFHNQIDYNQKWFQEKPFEKRLYEILHVKKWKDRMPTFAPEMLDIKVHTWEEIAGAMCQSELVHFIIVILSFVPILATFLWESFWVFFITSILAACMDSVFIIMQRYNRPRIVRMIERSRRCKGE